MKEENKNYIDCMLQIWKDKDVLRIQEVAVLLQCSRNHIDDLVRVDKIPSYKEGNKRYFKKDEIIKWMEENSKDENEKGGKGYVISASLCKDAVDVFGVNNQIMKLLEEMAELQNAILKYQQRRDTLEHVQEELADVKIMLAQMCIIFNSRGVNKHLQEKIERLKERVNQRKIEKVKPINTKKAKQGEIDFEDTL